MLSVNNKDDFQIIFKMPSSSIFPFLIEVGLKGGYKKFIYCYQHNYPDTEYYLSERNLNKLGKIGFELYKDRKKFQQFLNDEKILSNKISSYIKRNPFHFIQKGNISIIIAYLKNIYTYHIAYSNLYCFTECIYTSLIEKTIKEYVSKKAKNQNEINRYLSILLNSSNDKCISNKQNDILHCFNASNEIIQLCSSIKKIGQIRLNMRTINDRFWILFEQTLGCLASKMNISTKHIKQLFYNEIIKLSRSKKFVLNQKLLSEIVSRQSAFVGYTKDGIFQYVTGRKAEIIINKLRNKVPEKIIKFSGDIASLGKVTGKVIIFPMGLGKKGKNQLINKIKLMNQGDILVTSTTGPDMVIACKKAAAIIAEEGGILSHAAIISREFGIPAIVNTKIATKILKDGDMVNVDAYKGIVTIL